MKRRDIVPKLLLGLILCSSGSIYASSYKGKVVYEKNVINQDKSVTFYSPKLLRGNKTFYLAESSSKGSCSLLDYDENINFSTILSEEKKSDLVLLDDNGDFVKTIENQKPIEKVTCYNKSQYEIVVDYDSRLENEDRSVTFTNPSVLIGEQKYPIMRSLNFRDLDSFTNGELWYNYTNIMLRQKKQNENALQPDMACIKLGMESFLPGVDESVDLESGKLAITFARRDFYGELVNFGFNSNATFFKDITCIE